jgi:hypothetical protein
MKDAASKHHGFNIRGITWLLLFIFSGLLSAEILHSHVKLASSEDVFSNASDQARIKEPQTFCEICDYVLHKSSRLIPVAYQFIEAPVKINSVIYTAQTQFVYTFYDLLLFSGSSPPIA